MVQGKLKRTSSLGRRKKSSGQDTRKAGVGPKNRRKARGRAAKGSRNPHLAHKRRVARKVTGAINRNIEEIMAARLAKDGGVLHIVPTPAAERVDVYSKPKGVTSNGTIVRRKKKGVAAQNSAVKSHGKLSRSVRKARKETTRAVKKKAAVV